MLFAVVALLASALAACADEEPTEVTAVFWDVTEASGVDEAILDSIELDFKKYQDDGVEPIVWVDGPCGLTTTQYTASQSGLHVDDYKLSDRGFIECVDREAFGTFLTLFGEMDTWSISDSTLTMESPTGEKIVAEASGS